MKNLISILLIICLNVDTFCQNLKKEIPSNTSFVVELESYNFKELIMGDNSSIIIPETIRNFSLIANTATIGKNCEIKAKPIHGIREVQGISPKPVASDCNDGEVGETGSSGNNGSPGCNMKIELGILSLGNLVIESRGGNGNFGLQGGDGGKAGSVDCQCPNGNFNTSGGNGGIGGKGGDGSTGGDVELICRNFTSNTSPLEFERIIKSSIRIDNSGGSGEQGNEGGNGEVGSSPFSCPCGSSTLNFVKGRKGVDGAIGCQGLNGKDGKSVILIFPKPR